MCCNCYFYCVVEADQSHPFIDISTGLQMAFGMTNKFERATRPWLQGAHWTSGTTSNIVLCSVIISQVLTLDFSPAAQTPCEQSLVFSASFSASFTRISPEISLGNSASRREMRV